jgi:hypothetical protein
MVEQEIYEYHQSFDRDMKEQVGVTADPSISLPSVFSITIFNLLL